MPARLPGSDYFCHKTLSRGRPLPDIAAGKVLLRENALSKHVFICCGDIGLWLAIALLQALAFSA